MKILLFGANGQLGWELQRSLASLGKVIAPLRAGDGPLCGDLNDLDGLRRTVQTLRPQVVVNAAAYTAVDRAESEPDVARRVNALASGVLAETCAALGAWLLHYSTDYVFDGSGTQPWTETHPTGPLSVYGRTKLEGEQRVQAGCGRHLIFRTSWVYGRHGQNFAKTMLRLAHERDNLSVVSDQYGVPTSAQWLAQTSTAVLQKILGNTGQAAPQADGAGIYHVCPRGETSWHAYAQWLLAQANAMGFALRTEAHRVVPIASAQYPTAAKRPLNSRLSCEKFDAVFGLARPDWQEGVLQLLTDLSAASATRQP